MRSRQRRRRATRGKEFHVITHLLLAHRFGHSCQLHTVSVCRRALAGNYSEAAVHRLQMQRRTTSLDLNLEALVRPFCSAWIFLHPDPHWPDLLPGEPGRCFGVPRSA